MDKQHLDMATVLQEKGWARKVEVKEGDIREFGLASLVHVIVSGCGQGVDLEYIVLSLKVNKYVSVYLKTKPDCFSEWHLVS